MPGLQTNLKDLGKSFEKLKCIMAESHKNETIEKYKAEFAAKGNSPWMAAKLAEEKYKLQYKHG